MIILDYENPTFAFEKPDIDCQRYADVKEVMHSTAMQDDYERIRILELEERVVREVQYVYCDSCKDFDEFTIRNDHAYCKRRHQLMGFPCVVNADGHIFIGHWAPENHIQPYPYIRRGETEVRTA